MKFVLFGASRRLGLLSQQRVIDLRSAARAAGQDTDVFASLVDLIESGDAGLEAAAALGEQFSLSDDPAIADDLEAVDLKAPFPGRRFALAGSNNAAHVAAYYRNRGQQTTAADVREKGRKDRAGGFWAVTEPTDPVAEVPVPDLAAGRFDYEAEVAIVLCRSAKRVTAARAGDLVWGSVLLIDWSIRSPTMAMPWYGHKNFDASKSLGPWISVGEVDPAQTVVETRVNGEQRQRFVNGEEMIFSYAELLEQLSENVTLRPGDLLAGGTGPGTVLDSSLPLEDGSLPVDPFLRPGDLVEVSAADLGSITARVVAPH